MPIHVNNLYTLWNDLLCHHWLTTITTDDDVNDNKKKYFSIKKSFPNKSTRLACIDDDQNNTNVDVTFYEKGILKSQITIQHNGLAGSSKAEEMKSYWKIKLDRLFYLASSKD
jgi:hypothetical protein